MKGNIGDRIKINSYASLFGETDDAVIEVGLDELYNFPDHPFQVKDDADMDALEKSITESGILNPLIIRARDGGGYEIVSGHRRRHAAERCGLKKVPAILRKISDPEAVVLMVDSNLHRERILPSEKAFSYKMKYDALARTQGRPKKEGHDVPDFQGMKTSEIIAKDAGESYKQIERYIKLTDLVPGLLAMVDEERIPIMGGYAISYIDAEKQELLLELLRELGKKLTVSDAKKIRTLAESGGWSKKALKLILTGTEKEKFEKREIRLSEKDLIEYFPENVTEETIMATIKKLLGEWKRRTG